MNDLECITSFCRNLLDFIIANDRLPSSINDYNLFNLDFDDVVYLIDNCKKFTLIESKISDERSEMADCPDFLASTSSASYNLNTTSRLLNEFKAASLLSIEIQKIITRRFVPIMMHQ